MQHFSTQTNDFLYTFINIIHNFATDLRRTRSVGPNNNIILFT